MPTRNSHPGGGGGDHTGHILNPYPTVGGGAGKPEPTLPTAPTQAKVMSPLGQPPGSWQGATGISLATAWQGPSGQAQTCPRPSGEGGCGLQPFGQTSSVPRRWAPREAGGLFPGLPCARPPSLEQRHELGGAGRGRARMAGTKSLESAGHRPTLQQARRPLHPLSGDQGSERLCDMPRSHSIAVSAGTTKWFSQNWKLT